MAHRRSFSSRGRTSETQRRKKAWLDLGGHAAAGDDLAAMRLVPPTLVAPGDSTQALVFPSQAGLIESTILRIRGSLTVPKSTFGTSGGGATTIFSFGIGIVSDQAALVTDGVPNPATATGNDWDGWMFIRGGSDQAAVDVTGTIVDVKAMRKWKSGDSIVFIAGMATDVAAGMVGQAFDGSLRGLFLLP